MLEGEQYKAGLGIWSHREPLEEECKENEAQQNIIEIIINIFRIRCSGEKEKSFPVCLCKLEWIAAFLM